MMRFEPGQLQQYLMKLEQKKVTGILTLTLELPSSEQVRKMVIAFKEGIMTFAGSQLMPPLKLVKFISAQLQANFLEPALKVVQPRVKQPDSYQEILDHLIHFGLYTWDAVEDCMQRQISIALELMLPYGGKMEFAPNTTVDVNYPTPQFFQVKGLLSKVKERRVGWKTLSQVVEGVDAVPYAQPNLEIEDTNITNHIQHWINGKNSIGTIALALNLDPLDLAKQYFQYSREGWIYFDDAITHLSKTPTQFEIAPESQNINKPIVLSVDDSSVVQTVIKRSISDRYEVLLANNAVDALNLLNSHAVALLLLDVTMPDIDGLELCRTIRNISKFRDLPVVMLTAKDGLIDKVKGQFAGSTHYMTKPIDREKLLTVLEKYIPQGVMA